MSEDVKANPFWNIDHDVDPSPSPCTNAIYAGIMAEQNEVRSNKINRPSSAGKCTRSLWYQNNGFEAEPMAGRAFLNFMNGNLGEYTMIHMLKKHCVGKGKPFKKIVAGKKRFTFPVGTEEATAYEQIRVDFSYEYEGKKIEIDGSVDFIALTHDGEWILGDCKTASDYGFKKFKTNDPGDYTHQAHAYMMSDLAKKHNITKFMFMCMRKNTGHLHDFTIDYDKNVEQSILRKFIVANGEEIPPREFEPEIETYYKKPTGRKILPWQCSYCAYTKECWGQNAEKVFDKNKKTGETKKDQNGNYKPKWVIIEKEEKAS